MANLTKKMSAPLKDSDKIGVFSTTMIAVAYAITLNNFTVGAGVDMSLRNGIIAAFFAWIALAFVWAMFGLMGQITGKEAADVFQYSYGIRGGKIPSICIVMANVVWAIFDYWDVGSVMRNMMPNAPHLGFALGMIIITACVIVGIIKDITSLKWLTTLTVPIAAVIFVIVFIATVKHSGGMEVLLNYQPAEGTPIVLAINAMFASFIAVSPGFMDIGRNCTSKKALIIAMPIGMLVVCIQYFVAQCGRIGLAASNLTALALTIGGSVFYLTNLFVIFGQINTAPSSSFVIVQQATSLLRRVPRKFFIFAQPLLACALAFAVEYGLDITILNNWVSLVSCIFSPLIGVLITEFFIHRCKMSDDEQLPAWAPAGLVSTAVGFALGVYLTYFCPTPTPIGFVCIIGTGVLHLILRKGIRLR